ncbi:phosphoesterase PA-phosphatase related protein (plasmid) [Oscillatoria nigro-viridis PCC 7112]|uniref:Phosphoesterase PA-phosphatase related protein n=1 Tax=Phormidium nigroviride PCC 7112 TaxID=179408 RepID=K9VSA7_9CYAN|nr:phosphatase PAP2 family protein [Oscillatoria nigro-viridis]AFZ10826.1 phosphoesterase PA-phosphatase related protein [Oscillatoria nigro-viridis PCC 7112]
MDQKVVDLVTAQNLLPSQGDLVAKFSKIDLPKTIEMGDRAKVNVKLTNQGSAPVTGPVTVKLYTSTDSTIDRAPDGKLVNDCLLTSTIQQVNLLPGQSTTVRLNYGNMTSVGAPGACNLIAEINQNNNTKQISKLVSATGSDVVLDWNATALNAIQAEGKAGRGVPPTVGSRLMAITSLSVYDAVNAFDRTHTSYAVNTPAPVGASEEAAAAAAAHKALVTLLPNQTQLFDRQLARSLAEIDDTPQAEADGVAFGNFVADTILASRANDGSSNNAPYVPPEGDYVWRPKTEGPNKGAALGPNWGKVKPFAIPNTAAFAPKGLDGVPGTDRFVQDLEEVRLLGGKQSTANTTVTRTPDQTEIAIFWADDRADTFRPYGQLNQIAEEVAMREETTVPENARLFAELNVALADAGIVAWDAKYNSKVIQPRPDDLITGGFGEKKGISGTVTDPEWEPLLSPTPPFPDYISGHSTFSGAFAGVMTNFFGDNYSFTAVSQEMPGVTRTYNSFYDAAYEDAISRVYGGVHVREATVDDALPTGLAVGNFVAQNLFKTVV